MRGAIRAAAPGNTGVGIDLFAGRCIESGQLTGIARAVT
jgi:hypothetical protein